MVATALGIVSYCFNFIAIAIFLLIIITGFTSRQDSRNIALMLTYNTCFAALLNCLATCIMSSSNISNGFLTFNLTFCCIWGLLYDMFECSIYHSYYIQAFYRLCRVVFYKKKNLLSFRLYLLLIAVQWSVTIAILLPPIFLGWYVQLPTEEYCLVPYTYLGPELYHIMILYMIPLISIATTYIWITKFIRQSALGTTITLATHQRQRNLRDLTVIRRIAALVSILIVLRFPTIIFMIYAVIVGHLYPLTFGIVGLISSICMIFIGLMMVQITPQLRNNRIFSLVYRDNRIFTQATGQQRLTLQSATAGGLGRVIDEQNQSTIVQRPTKGPSPGNKSNTD